MKTISARQFRLTFQELTEPVQVQRRRGSGEYEIVGTWSPTVQHSEGECYCEACTAKALGLQPLAPVRRSTFRPVPKPGKK